MAMEASEIKIFHDSYFMKYLDTFFCPVLDKNLPAISK